MMKSAFVDDQKDVDLSQSCNLGQEIMFFYALCRCSPSCRLGDRKFMSTQRAPQKKIHKINHKTLIAAHKSQSTGPAWQINHT